MRAVTGKPIKFAGTGEKLEDLEPFYPDRMASRILGMGDVLTLIEKAQTDFDAKKAAEMAERLKQNTFDFNDMLEQMQQLKKMGPLSSVMNMLPGAAGKIGDDEAEQGEKELRKVEAIIHSMTPAEREKPALINPSRKRRIAAGAAPTCRTSTGCSARTSRCEALPADVRRRQKEGQAPQEPLRRDARHGRRHARDAVLRLSLRGFPADDRRQKVNNHRR